MVTSRADWADFQERVRKKLYVDQSDACLKVEWLREDGSFVHGHVPLIFLERYEPEAGTPWFDLFQAGCALMRGTGSLEWYGECFRIYRQNRKAERLTGEVRHWWELYEE